MFYKLSDDLILHIMSFNNYTSLKVYNYVNKYVNKLYNVNKISLYKDIIKKHGNFVETHSAYNFQMKQKTISVTKNENSSLGRAMLLSKIFK